MEWDNLLNEQQLKGVYQTEGAVLVIAGAGSGKTRVLTYRIAHLLEMGVAPTRILAITFTNKATNEMRERIETLCPQAKGLWISTFHALCARILRRHIDLLGYTKDFTIYDDVESSRMVKKIIKNKQLDEKMYLNKTIWHISNAKNKGLSPDKYQLTMGDPNADIICSIYERYEEEMKLNNALDYDDLLLKTVILFVQHPDVLREYQERFMYIHIDEYQDTNKIQYALVKMLADLHGNLFAVGDEDQSIYGWRGADISNILSFRKDFEGATVIKLEQNYRSTANILAASNALIKNNRNRFGKTLWSNLGDGDSVVIEHRATDGEEAEYVVTQIGSMLRSGDYQPRDFAILVRLNALTSKFEERLNSYNIPYKVFGGFRFFERKEIKDVLAYCRLLVNPRDSEALLRAINTPKRGIGEAMVTQLVQYAAARSMSPAEVLLDGFDTAVLAPATIKKLGIFRDLYADLFGYYRSHGIGDTVRYIVEKAGFALAYAGDDEETYNKRLNIDELIQSAEEFERENVESTMSEYLQSVTLSSDSDEILEDNYVSVATVHAVKGLEFPVVFVVGLEENIFPSGAYNKTDVEIEEERRVMYVAMTRAQRRLYMTYCDSRYRFGHYEYNKESRFLTEIKTAMGWVAPQSKQSTWAPTRKEWGARATTAGTLRGTISGNANQTYRGNIAQNTQAPRPITAQYRVGDKVSHPKFGKGMVIGVDGDIANIAFDSVGIKRLSLKVAPLTKL